MSNPFAKATKKQAKLRLAIIGSSGSGKTYTALSIATGLGKTAVIDTERGSASKYAGLFEFDVLELTDYNPQKYIDAIKAAADNGYESIVIDSLSHAWNAQGGVLELVDKAAARSQSKNSFAAWRDVTPLHNKLIDAIVGAPVHVIATMRAKTEYVMEEVISNGRKTTMPRKVGLAPVQRDGMEYEFDVVADMDQENNFMVSKSRCFELNSAVIAKPGKDLVSTLKNWLTDGAIVDPPLKVVEDSPKTDLKATPSDLASTTPNHEEAPTPAQQTAIQDLKDAVLGMTDPDFQPYQEWELKNAVLKTFYNNNTYHMNKSLKKLQDNGELHPGLSLEQAILVVETRKEEPA